MNGEENFQNQIYTNSNIKIRDLEEKQRILKDRILLIGQNLIEVKKELEETKQILKKVNRFVENISAEFSKFARKDDLEILKKQAKMFQPLEFLKTENEKKILNKQ